MIALMSNRVGEDGRLISKRLEESSRRDRPHKWMLSKIMM